MVIWRSPLTEAALEDNKLPSATPATSFTKQIQDLLINNNDSQAITKLNVKMRFHSLSVFITKYNLNLLHSSTKDVPDTDLPDIGSGR